MTRTVACQACGGVLQDTDRFCARCGASITTLADNAAPAGRVPSVWDLVGDALRAATRGEFDIAGELGHGGMAAVYLAHDIALDKKVAIKVMAPTLMADRSMLERFLQEARTVAKLEHPHIVTVHAARQAGGLNFFVMKFVQGLELEAILQRTGALRLAVTQAILYEVASALQYAHDRDVIHRDVKPSNVMLDTSGKAFVTDFGIAKLKGGKGLTMHGAAIGTPQYMSPEQCMAGPVSAASDQYSLGVVAYHMLAGGPPFNGEPLTVMRAQCDEPAPPLERLADGPCPPNVRAAIERMLAKDPEARWPSVLHAAQMLGGHPLAPDDPLRAEIVRLVKTPDFIPPTAMFTTPLSPSPAIQRAEAAPPASRPTTPVLPVARVERGAPRTAALPVFDELRVSGAPRAIAPGASFALRAVLTNRSGTTAPATEVVWESSDLTVATVDASGRVRAVGPGRVTFTASAQGMSASVRLIIKAQRPIPWRLIGGSVAGLAAVAVVALVVLKPPPPPPPPPVGRLRIEPATLSMTVGTETPLEVRDAPQGASPVWRSSDTTVIVVNNAGRVTAVAAGTADVVAHVGPAEVRATVRVDRAEVRVATVRLAPPRGSLIVGRTLRLSAAVFDPAGKPIAGRSVVWRSSDNATASVSNDGIVGGVAPGSAQIVAAVDGVEAVAAIQVTAPKRDEPPAAAVVTVVVSPADLALTVGETRTLAAAPRDVQGRPLQRPITWQSEDDAIARVSQAGVVAGVGPGRAQVVATSDGVAGSATVTVTPPVALPPPPPTAVVIVSLAAGRRHTCAWTQTGQVWCWGDNAAGQVRAGAGAAVPLPATLETKQVGILAAGGSHTCGLRDDGQAVCWGSNLEGQLGGGVRTAREAVVAGRRFTALAAGTDHTCGLTPEGNVVCWGKNDFGQLGDGSTSRRTTPTAIAAPGPFTAIAAGATHTCALHRDGRLFCWGDDWSGQVGSGMTQSILVPTPVGGAFRFDKIGAGQTHTCGITREGRMYCWGQSQSSPTLIKSSEGFAALAVGGEHTCALTRAGRALCWGRGQEGQLGNGMPLRQSAPIPVRTPEEFVSLAAGQNHTCGLTKTGLVVCWGANARGELGTGTATASLVPTPVAELRP